MKCSKCGEECNENQAFCLKCGTPIQIIPDLNIIEEELANNVGELMDELREEEKTKELLKTAHNIYDYEYGRLQDTVEYDTLENFKPIQLDEELEEKIQIANLEREKKKNLNMNTGYTVDSSAALKKSRSKRLSEEELRERHEKKVFKLKITFAIAAIIVVLIVVSVLIFLPSSDSKSSAFKSYYNKGMKAYNAGDYGAAVQSYEQAYEVADDKYSLKKVLTSLWDAYKKIDGTDNNQMDVIRKLIDIEPDNLDYYEALLSLYEANGMVEDIDKLLKSVAGTDIAAQLTGYSFMGPEFNYESGKYEQFLYITLSNDNGYKMYYTTDGSEPTSSSTEYTESFEINNEGVTVVKAISVNEKGISSTVVKKEFDIQLSVLTAPTVTPDSGTYTTVTKIEVQVPGGCTAYYTLDEDGTTPTASSNKYEGPIDMPVGKNVFSVITVNESGVYSSVTQKIYQLDVDRTYTYNQALDSLKANLIASGFIIDNEGKTADGGIVGFSYVGVQVIEGNEYYLIKTSTGEVFGVGTVTGVIVNITQNNKGIYEIAK